MIMKSNCSFNIHFAKTKHDKTNVVKYIFLIYNIDEYLYYLLMRRKPFLVLCVVGFLLPSTLNFNVGGLLI